MKREPVKRRKGTVILLAILAILFVAVLTKTALSNSAQTADSSVLINEAKSQSKPAWVLVRSTTCEPCLEMTAIFTALKPKYEAKIAFIEVDVYDSKEENLLRELKIQYIPTTVLIDQEGQIVFNEPGVFSEEEISTKLDALLGEQK